MKIAIASDHGGFALKGYLLGYYKKQGISLEDLGTHSEESCDYPLIADALCRHILDGRAELGILICGTGIGISIAANRHKGIRAALLYNADVARLAREHNNANVIAFGARTQNKEDVVRYIDIFLASAFEGGRHQRRIDELDTIGD